ncbi:MAG: hypothetical protein ABJF01_15885 [bacterium]
MEISQRRRTLGPGEDASRNLGLFWQITADGYPPWPGPDVYGDERDDFFVDLVAKEWPKIQGLDDSAGDVPIGETRTVLVLSDDGVEFACRPMETAGSYLPKYQYWEVIDPSGVAHVGPPYAAAQTMGEVRRMVNDWWQMKQDSGPLGTNAFAMRLIFERRP